MLEHGFLGYDASFMLDFVVCALILVVPLLLVSLFAVKVRRKYGQHRFLQVALGIILLVAVGLFEADMQWHGGWQQIVNKNPEAPRLTGEALSHVKTVLYIHLIFAISTPFLWAVTLGMALKKFAKPLQPGPHSRLHSILGWASTIDITMTAITGLWFYYVAFVQTAVSA